MQAIRFQLGENSLKSTSSSSTSHGESERKDRRLRATCNEYGTGSKLAYKGSVRCKGCQLTRNN
jgi:hypothetical protein